jgi:hypothetical protein
VKAERVARAAEDRAHRGKPNGTVPYGYRRRYTTDPDGAPTGSVDVIHEPEAAVVREIVGRLLDGETVGGITADLNRRNVPPPGAAHRIRRRSPTNRDGSRWGRTSVRKLAMRATNAGLRTHRGVVVGRGQWEPIVTQEQHDAVVGLLTGPTRPTNGGESTRKHLLSFGVGECGVCGTRLRVAAKQGNQLYVCDSPRGCTGRRVEWVDGLAEQVMVATLQRRDVRGLLARGDGEGAKARLHLDELRARMADASAAYAAGRLPLAALTAITDQLGPQIADAERSAAAARPMPAAVRGLVGGGDVAGRWQALGVAEKRTVMKALHMRVVILPAPKGPGFKPEYVRVSWDAS